MLSLFVQKTHSRVLKSIKMIKGKLRKAKDENTVHKLYM